MLKIYYKELKRIASSQNNNQNQRETGAEAMSNSTKRFWITSDGGMSFLR
jgi:hypothetical protein